MQPHKFPISTAPASGWKNLAESAVIFLTKTSPKQCSGSLPKEKHICSRFPIWSNAIPDSAPKSPQPILIVLHITYENLPKMERLRSVRPIMMHNDQNRLR